MSRKPNYQDYNLPRLLKLCEELGLEVEKKDTWQYRIYGATHIIDIWPPRMTYHILSGETIRAVEPYYRELDTKINLEQVKELLLTGKFTK